MLAARLYEFNDYYDDDIDYADYYYYDDDEHRFGVKYRNCDSRNSVLCEKTVGMKQYMHVIEAE